MAKLPRIEGCLTAIVTPFKQGKVDFENLAKLVDWQIEQGVDGIVAVGTTGESATLDVEEHVAVIAAVVKAAKGRVPVVAGAGGNATAEALTLTKAFFLRMVTGDVGATDLLLSDQTRIEGSRIDLGRFFALLDKTPGNFPIVTR